VAGRQADDLAEELLVDLPQDVGGQDAELVGTLGVVQPADDVLEGFVVDRQRRREAIGRAGTAFLLGEVEQPRVVTGIGLAEELLETAVGAAAVEQSLQAAVGFDRAVLADAQEDDAVDGRLHGVVHLALRE